MAPEGYPQAETNDVNGWLSSVPDEDMDFDQYQQIMEILYPELAEEDEEDEDDMADIEDDDDMEDIPVASGSNARVASASNAGRTKKAQTVANILTSTTFTAEDAQYIAYDSRYYTWSAGTEGSFRLQANNYIVYSDLAEYPMLQSEGTYYWLIIFIAGVAFLFVIYRSLFSPGRVRI